MFLPQISTVSGDTVQMQLEYKSMRKASFEQMKSPASLTSSMAVAMGYETLCKMAIPMQSVFLGMGDLQDKIQPMPVAVCVFNHFLLKITTNNNKLYFSVKITLSTNVANWRHWPTKQHNTIKYVQYLWNNTENVIQTKPSPRST